MKYCSFLFLALLLASITHAQSRSNESVQQQIKSLGADGAISLSYDAGSNVTTLRAVADNFSDAEAKRAGVRAMNFAAGIIYLGKTIDRPAEPIQLSFWVLSSKPRFGEDHTLAVFAGGEPFQMGEARYVARARDGMEYLNFNLTREQLRQIAKQSSIRFLLGQKEFNFTRSQLKLLADLYLVTELSK
jgi:hypothetical protein